MAKKTKEYEVAWLCNGKNPKCRNRPGCYYNIQNGIRGSCDHTMDPKYAINKNLDPKKDKDRFDKFTLGDQIRYYERW
ncbi:hypothetical protein [Pseudobutyrivibrio sp.]